MSREKSSKVIFDTNVLISFLIGKKLLIVKNLVVERQLIIILSDQLLLELRTVTKRPKLAKYFPNQEVEELIEFLQVIGHKHEAATFHQLSRDPKDNFLLDLADISEADYLVTGDKDLLILNPFKVTKILTPSNFESELSKLNR